MKYIILSCFILIITSVSYAGLVARELKCSRSGTDVLLVNGINWKKEIVQSILDDDIEPKMNMNYLDSKGNVNYKISYNYSNGFLRDMLESAVQKISQNFNVSPEKAFVAAYYFTYKGVVSADFIGGIFDTKAITFSAVSTFLTGFFNPNVLDKMIQDALSQNLIDTKALKSSISNSLLAGKKLILITESQGNFFGKQALSDLLDGEKLNANGKTGNINDFLGTIGQVQIAPPTRSLLSKNKVVLNDKDIINLIFFEKPESNFALIPPSPDLRRSEIDQITNHFITSTYLNDENMTTGNLSALRDFTLQSIVDLASSLDSNCPKAVINYAKNNLVVNFDSTDPQNPNVTGLTYIWDFGDGVYGVNTTNKLISHTYNSSKKYDVKLIVVDSFNGTDSITKTIEVKNTNTNEVAICANPNGGLIVSYNISINNSEPFNITYYPPTIPNGPTTCECHMISVPSDSYVSFSATGTFYYPGITDNLAPLSGEIYGQTPGLYKNYYISFSNQYYANGNPIFQIGVSTSRVLQCDQVNFK